MYNVCCRHQSSEHHPTALTTTIHLQLYDRLKSKTYFMLHLSIFDVSLSDIAVSGRNLPKALSVHNNVWLTDSECEKLKLIAELLCIKHDYLKLDLLSADKVGAVIEFLCTT